MLAKRHLRVGMHDRRKTYNRGTGRRNLKCEGLGPPLLALNMVGVGLWSKGCRQLLKSRNKFQLDSQKKKPKITYDCSLLNSAYSLKEQEMVSP